MYSKVTGNHKNGLSLMISEKSVRGVIPIATAVLGTLMLVNSLRFLGLKPSPVFGFLRSGYTERSLNVRSSGWTCVDKVLLSDEESWKWLLLALISTIFAGKVMILNFSVLGK